MRLRIIHLSHGKGETHVDIGLAPDEELIRPGPTRCILGLDPPCGEGIDASCGCELDHGFTDKAGEVPIG